MVITCLDSVLAAWQEKIKFSQKLEADLSLPWWESMTKLNWAGFCFLLVNVAHNRNFYSKCSWKCNPKKETCEKGEKADCILSQKIQTFTTSDVRLCSTLRTLGMLKSWENRREHELLVHVIGFPDSHRVSRIIPTSEPSALTECIDFNPYLCLKSCKRCMRFFLNFIFKCKCFNMQRNNHRFWHMGFSLWFWRISLLCLFWLFFFFFCICFALFCSFVLHCVVGIFVCGVFFLCCSLLGFLFVFPGKP